MRILAYDADRSACVPEEQRQGTLISSLRVDGSLSISFNFDIHVMLVMAVCKIANGNSLP